MTARLKLRVQPRAKSAGVVGRDSAGTWKVKVKEPAQEGRANQAVTALLAEWLEVPRRAVRVVHGLSSRDKQVEVDGLGIEEVEARIEAALAEAPRPPKGSAKAR